MLSRYGVRAFPTLFLVNSTMRVRYHGSRTMNSLGLFYKDVTGMNPVALDAISLERMEEVVNITEDDKKTEQEDALFIFARSPDRLLHQDTCLALASSFVLLRLLCFLLPKLNACVKQAWRLQFYELKRLFPSLS
uniref:Thioredoxin domain-containing protein n=2 Tax=Oryza brachyantha TaxID=4533 RepID=J3MSZ1_ORYBR